MSIYSMKSASAQGQNNQPWTAIWTPGVSLVNFFSLYNFHSLADVNGDATISGATSIATTLDGPIQVAKFRNLTVNAALGATNRCRGLMPICDTLTMGASGSISMTGLGASGSSKWAYNRDIFVPQSITFTGKNTGYAQFLAWIRATGYCIFDPNLYAAPLPGMGDVQCDWSTWTPQGSVIISASGCGAQTAATACGTIGTNGGPETVSGYAGSAGTSAPGGGGGGAAAYYHSSATAMAYGGCGGPGTPWGGGDRGTGVYNTNVSTPLGKDGILYGANTPGPGGVLVVVCRVSASFTAGAVLPANGVADATAYSGGVGGGKVGLYYASGSTAGLSMTATGASANASTPVGGAGGAGHTEAATFASKGW